MKPFFSKFQSYSHTWKTTLMVMLMVTVSVTLSLWFFWRSLYLPELQNHASYLANQLAMLDKAEKQWREQPHIQQWILTELHLDIIDEPENFPNIEKKAFVGLFTNTIAEKISKMLNRPAIVYFEFKPVPKLYIQDSRYPNRWIAEPVQYYAEYSPSSIFFFLLGIPIITLLTILFLVRHLNRPLIRLQKAAMDYINLGHATTLPTHSGSAEIRQVNIAFNRLFHNLNQTQKERTIMLAGISHDLRTPLTRMRLTAEMLPDEFLREGLVYDIEDMDAILEQFISFMKDGSDEAVRLTNLRPIFNEIIIQFQPLPFLLQIPDDLPSVPLRPLSIKRLIINLVNNANRYGRPPIHLSANILSTKKETYDNNQPKQFLQISVSDEGDGVAEDQLERIMQPFERGETARTTQGSGLGLAIVNRIAHLHNGTVIAHNKPEGGLEVCVTIPIIN